MKITIPLRLLTVVLPLFASSAVADSMYCNGNIVSTGDSQKTVLNNCGEPTSRNGDQWVYQSQDQNTLSKIVTFGGGAVESISDGNFPGFQNTPFENQP